MRRLAFVSLLLLAAAPVLFAAQLRQVAMIDLPGRPGFQGMTFAGSNLLLAHEAADKLEVFDTAKRRVIASVEGLEAPHGVAAAGERVYVANGGSDSIAVISTSDWKVLETIQLNARPYALALTPDGKRLVSANWRDRSLTVIDLATGYRQQTIDLQGAPSRVAFAGDRMFVTLQDRAEIAAIAPDGKISVLKLAASQPTGIVATPNRLYVAVRFAVLAIDPNSGAELGRVAAPSGVDSLWLDTASGTLYAGSNGAINVISTGATLTAEDEIRAEVKGQSLAFDPNKGLIYVPGGRDGRSKLLILRNVQAQPLLQPRTVANK